jgi:hypothetical protein
VRIRIAIILQVPYRKRPLVAQPFRAARAGVGRGRPKGLRYNEPPQRGILKAPIFVE